jgi:hypothetical protein
MLVSRNLTRALTVMVDRLDNVITVKKGLDKQSAWSYPEVLGTQAASRS